MHLQSDLSDQRKKTEGRLLRQVKTGGEAKARLTPKKFSMTLPLFAAIRT